MKKLLLSVVVMIIFLGCSFDYPVIPNLGLTTIEEVAAWTHDNIEYEADTPLNLIADIWQSPEETYLRGAGDCEDFTVLFMYLVHEQLGIETDRIEIVMATEPFDDRVQNHGFAAVDSIWYDPTNFKGTVDVEWFEQIWEKFTYRSYTWAMVISY